MTVPAPKVALENVCSVIFNNTLYTYSANAFQALPLEAGGKWEELPQGEKVTGGVCVGSTTGNPDTSAFFVVGGKGTTPGYQGLQKYTYSTGKWESIELPKPVTQNRLGHSATYINATDSILVYAGSQEGFPAASTQTFTIGAAAPHSVLAFESIAPPALSPILLPWSANEAVMVGGSSDNTRVMLFSTSLKWVDSGATLAQPITKPTTDLQAIVVTGDDGSKNLITFDMTVSPNTVRRTVLYHAPGVPAIDAKPVGRRWSRASGQGHKIKRQATTLTEANWPSYNDTLAPAATRNNFALSRDENLRVVIAGGNEEDVLCIFDARANSWQNATDLLSSQVRLASTEDFSTTVSSAEPTSTVFSTASSSAAAAPTGVPAAATPGPSPTSAAETGGVPLTIILAVVLGSVFGLAFLLLALYFCRRRRAKQRAHLEAGHLRRSSGVSSPEKGSFGISNDNLPFTPGHPGVFRGHQTQGSQSTLSSMALLMGGGGAAKSKSPTLRGPSQNAKRDSTDSIFRTFKSTISKPISQTTTVQSATVAPLSIAPQQQQREESRVAFTRDTAEPRPRNLTSGVGPQDATRRSSGWNRYWSGGSALNLLGFGGSGNGNNGGNTTTTGPNSGGRVPSERSSQYSDPHRMTQDSATVPALQLYEPRASFSQVPSRSPTIAQHTTKLNQGMTGRIETQRPVSAMSDASGSAYSSGIPASVHEAWDPTETNRPWGTDRALNNGGMYTTPLTPATHGTRNPPAVRDDMSWLNLGGS